MAIVYGSLNLAGIDGQDSDPKFFSGTIPLLWDTGAHTSIIVEDMLTPSFRAYLQDKQHDDYRSQDQTRVQVDATVGFTNCLMELTTIFLVVPRRSVPNEYVGAIIGQRGFIDRLQYRSVPKKILIAMDERGECLGRYHPGTVSRSRRRTHSVVKALVGHMTPGHMTIIRYPLT